MVLTDSFWRKRACCFHGCSCWTCLRTREQFYSWPAITPTDSRPGLSSHITEGTGSAFSDRESSHAPHCALCCCCLCPRVMFRSFSRRYTLHRATYSQCFTPFLPSRTRPHPYHLTQLGHFRTRYAVTLHLCLLGLSMPNATMPGVIWCKVLWPRAAGP